MIRVSVIVPAYNAQKTIKQCLDSLAKQTLKDLEIIVVNDGSTDETGTICDVYAQQDSRFHIFHTKNQGVSAARNRGMLEAKGQYIGFVDSDDDVAPEMFEKLLQLIATNNSQIALCSHIDYIKNKAYPYQLPMKEGVYEDEQKIKHLLIPLIGGTSLSSHKKEVLSGYVCRMLFDAEFLREKGIRFICEKHIQYEDLIFVMESTFEANRIAVTHAQLYHYRQQPGSLVRTYKEGVGEAQKNLCDTIEQITRKLKVKSIEVQNRLDVKRIIGLLEAIDHTVGARRLNERLHVIKVIEKLIEDSSIQQALKRINHKDTSLIHRYKLKCIRKRHYQRLYFFTYLICNVKKFRGEII